MRKKDNKKINLLYNMILDDKFYGGRITYSKGVGVFFMRMIGDMLFL